MSIGPYIVTNVKNVRLYWHTCNANLYVNEWNWCPGKSLLSQWLDFTSKCRPLFFVKLAQCILMMQEINYYLILLYKQKAGFLLLWKRKQGIGLPQFNFDASLLKFLFLNVFAWKLFRLWVRALKAT